MKKKERGISKIVATIILISICLINTIAVVTWISGIVGKYMDIKDIKIIGWSYTTLSQTSSNDGIQNESTGGTQNESTTPLIIKKHIIAYGNTWVKNDETINFIASHFDIVILDLDGIYEKPTVLNMLKSINPNIIILLYRDIMAMHTGYEDWSKVNPNEDWFVHDTDGNRLVNKEYGWYCMDVGNNGWRNHYANFVKSKLDQFPLLDGVFADDTWSQFSAYPWTVPAEKVPADIINRWHNDQLEMLRLVKQTIGSKLLIPNTPQHGGDYIDNSDGKMEEGFVHAPWEDASGWVRGTGEAWKKRVDSLSIISRNGKYYIAQSGTKEKDTDTCHRIMLFCLTSYLLGVHGSTASFGWEDIYSPSKGYWAEFDKAAQLGAPIDDYYTFNSIYARDFENGKVLVNPSTSSYYISLDRNYKTLEGEVVSSVTLDGHTGIILLNS